MLASSPRTTTDPTYRAGSPAARHMAISTKVYSEHDPLPREITVGAVFHPPVIS